MIELASRVGVDKAAPSTATLDSTDDIDTVDEETLDVTENKADDYLIPAGDTPDTVSNMSLIALEFATGIGVTSSWEDDAESGESCADDQCAAADAIWTFCKRASAAFCAKIGAKKLGHMSVLSSCDIYPPREDLPGGAKELTEIRCVIGPFWPFTLCVTYPLILCISGGVAFVLLPNHSAITSVVWACCVAALLVALSCTACRDPGVLRRHPQKPDGNWRWNDQARTFRPPGAVYDEDLGVVVTEFDHVCPWTGTAIGQKNLTAFHCFVSMLCVCVVFDILIVMNIVP